MTPSPELVELCGYVGFDYVIIDRMVTSVDWIRASEMVRAADAFNVASIIRRRPIRGDLEGTRASRPS